MRAQLVNRVQKLRKKAGLAVTDAVEIWLRCPRHVTRAVQSQARALPFFGTSKY